MSQDINASDCLAIALEKMREEGYPVEYRKGVKALLNSSVDLEQAAFEDFSEEDDFSLEDFDDEDIFATEGIRDVWDKTKKLGSWVGKKGIEAAKLGYTKIGDGLVKAGKEIAKESSKTVEIGIHDAIREAAKLAARPTTEAAGKALGEEIHRRCTSVLKWLVDKMGTLGRKKQLTRSERAMEFLRKHGKKGALAAGGLGVVGGAGYYLTRRERDNARDDDE